MHIIGALLLGLLLVGCAVQTGGVHERFVPTSDIPATNWAQLDPLDETTWNEGRIPVSTDANWTRLAPGPGGEPGVLMVMAHAGIGDTFPVRSEGGHTHFVVIVAEGDDQRLQLVVHSKEGAQAYDVWRDKPVKVMVGEGKYELLFPTTTVAAVPGATPSTDKPLIIVRHLQ